MGGCPPAEHRRAADRGSAGSLAASDPAQLDERTVAQAAMAFVAYLVGKLLFNTILPRYAQSRVAALVSGVILYALLASIPYLGWVIATITTFIGLGALWEVATSRETVAIEPVTVAPPAEEHLGVA